MIDCCYCLFEQSGTFKNEFKKLGIPAMDFDIQNNFGETDFQMDLFEEIEAAFAGERTIFDVLKKNYKDPLVFAFFPCVYFSCCSAMWFSHSHRDYEKWSVRQITENIIDRAKHRETFFIVLNKLISICMSKDIKLIIENSYTGNSLLKFGFAKPPDIIDTDRRRRGDFYKKPTAYWFFGFEPTFGESYQLQKEERFICKQPKGKKAGVCGEERSLISPDYARNFICDFIIGKKQDNTKLDLFGG